MLTFFKRLTAPPVFEGDEEKTRAAELLNSILILLALGAIISLFTIHLFGSASLQTYIAIAAFGFLMIAMQLPMRRGYVKPVAVFIVLISTVNLTYTIMIGGTIRVIITSFYISTTIMSGLIVSRRALYWTAIANVVIVLGIIWLETNGRLPKPVFTVNIQQGIMFFMATVIVVLLLGTALKRLNESLEKARLGEENLSILNVELEQRVNERTIELLTANKQAEKRASQLQVVADVARTATSIQELSQLLNPLTYLISQRFGYYHVGIFLLDAQGQYAILEATNTEGGLIMLRRGHRLKVGEQGVVGFVTSRGEARIALDAGQDAVFFDNPDLPNTRSELALPLKISEKIIGALDLQSTEESAFSAEDISVLAILADQVAIAIQNARSAERAKRALLEAESATKQLSGEVWKEYTDKVKSRGYRYDGVRPEPLNGREKSSEEKDALMIPVQIRGQIIGRLKLKASDAARKWTDDERAIIESTAERVALAMESARLLDEAQKRAARETFLSEIGAKLGTSFQLDSILRDTVEELGQTLKGSTVSFQLVNPSAPFIELNDENK